MAKQDSDQPADEGTQMQAFEGGAGSPPPDWIQPPNSDQFDNATHLMAGPEVVERVNVLLRLDEFKDLRSHPCEVVWRKKTKPTAPDGETPVLASVEVAPLLWKFLTEGVLGFCVNLHWAHFEVMREDGNYVHPDTLDQHVHHALMHLAVSAEGVLGTRGATVQVFPETVGRYGLHTPAIVTLSNQMKLWEQDDR